MSVFDRVAGLEEDKIPLWGLLTHFQMLLDGDAVATDVVTAYQLDTTEQAELSTYLTRVNTLVTDKTTALVSDGLSNASATELARALVGFQFLVALHRAEQSLITKAEFESKFGVGS